MSSARRRDAVAVLWAAAVVGAGWTGTALAARDQSKAKPVTHTVTIDATSYAPKTLVVHAGDTIVWDNKDVIAHTATAKGTFDSQTILSGASWRYTVSKKGVVDYACLFHPTMTGTLNVQ